MGLIDLPEGSEIHPLASQESRYRDHRVHADCSV